ncbi:MAG: SRPBCC family protein [Fimbriimonas sp.]
MVEIPSSPEIAIVSGDFRGFTANALYEHFVDPELLTAWWPQRVEMDVRVAGALVMSWPELGWTLRGVFTAIEPGKHVGFTWNFDHEPNNRERFVDIWFMDMEELGSRMAVHHGPFGTDEAEQLDRRGIIEGWIHFGMKLAGLRVGDAT